MTVTRCILRCQDYVVRWPADDKLYRFCASEGWCVRMAGAVVWPFKTRAEARTFAGQKP